MTTRGPAGPQPTSSPTSSRTVAATLTGVSSWYDDGPGYYAAAHEYRDGTRVIALVESFHGGRTWSVTLPLRTQCGVCRFQPGATLLDLSPAAFRALGWPLSKGIAPVTVTILEGTL